MEEQKESLPEKKAVTGATKAVPRGPVQKFFEIFVSKDAGNVKSYIFRDVLLPAIKKAIFDIVKNSTGVFSDAIQDSISIKLYGEKARGKGGTNASRVSYKDCFEPQNQNWNRYHRTAEPPRIIGGYDYNDIVFENRDDAEEVLDRMDEAIKVYRLVTVATLYELASIPDHNYTNQNYGWTNISTAEILRTRDYAGWVLKLPRPMPIN